MSGSAVAGSALRPTRACVMRLQRASEIACASACVGRGSGRPREIPGGIGLWRHPPTRNQTRAQIDPPRRQSEGPTPLARYRGSVGRGSLRGLLASRSASFRALLYFSLYGSAGSIIKIGYYHLRHTALHTYDIAGPLVGSCVAQYSGLLSHARPRPSQLPKAELQV